MSEKWWARIWTARDGLGAIEFGFIAPILIVMLLGVLDFGMAFWQQMEIANAADAGTQWGMSNTYNESSIRTVAQSATNLDPANPDLNFTVTPTNVCGCVNSATNTITTGYGTAPACGAACPAGSVSGTSTSYTVVDAQICYKPVFPSWPGLTYGTGGCAANKISLTAQSFVLK
jgi:Flp pilus assembly protein TadG